MKKPRHRVFDYPPRYYKPETDEQERRKRRLGFTRQRKHISRRRNPVVWAIFILVVIYIILKLQGSV
jgi:uncharacterized membrane protein YvbJ